MEAREAPRNLLEPRIVGVWLPLTFQDPPWKVEPLCSIRGPFSPLPRNNTGPWSNSDMRFEEEGGSKDLETTTIDHWIPANDWILTTSNPPGPSTTDYHDYNFHWPTL